MSAVDVSCYTIPSEKESGGGEMNPFKTPPSGSSTSHLIVSEIMNDILDNTFEVIMSKTLQPPKPEKISPNVVGDILDNILSPTQDTSVSNRHDETALLDDEIKKIINEMKYPPEPKNIISTKGVGDQLNKVEIEPDKVFAEPLKRNTLERKSRLTNLVRNSKQMLTKLVTSEREIEVRSKSEEINEKVVKVIDLEREGSAEAGSSATGILQMPSDSGMDMVDLEPNLAKEETRDEEKSQEKVEDKTETVNIPSVKKKLSFGSKLMRLIRRNKDSKRGSQS